MWFYRIEQTINLFLYIEGNVSWKINHIQALLPFSGYNHTPSTAVIGQCLHFSGGRLQCTDENELQCNAELLYMHFWCKVSNSFFGGKTCWLLETKWSKSNATKVLILGSVFLYILTSQMKINTLYCSSCFSFNVIAFPSGIVSVYTECLISFVHFFGHKLQNLGSSVYVHFNVPDSIRKVNFWTLWQYEPFFF